MSSDRARPTQAMARVMWSLLEPIHAVTYFSPEPLEALKTAGFRGFWMGYFAGRAAPLGPVGPEVVHALFYNFRLERVARALPAAWQFGAPHDALRARLNGSTAALRRLIPTAILSDIGRAADLVERAAFTTPMTGRALFAANRALDKPNDPVGRLWHAATLLREHRGDGHVSALLSAGISGREAHVLVSVAKGVPYEVYRTARDFNDDEWSECRKSLRARDLVDASGLSARGQALVDQIEGVTDTLAADAFDSLTTLQQVELQDLLLPVTSAVVDGGDIPLDSPMGLNLRTVTQRSADML